MQLVQAKTAGLTTISAENAVSSHKGPEQRTQIEIFFVTCKNTL